MYIVLELTRKVNSRWFLLCLSCETETGVPAAEKYIIRTDVLYRLAPRLPREHALAADLHHSCGFARSRARDLHGPGGCGGFPDVPGAWQPESLQGVGAGWPLHRSKRIQTLDCHSCSGVLVLKRRRSSLPKTACLAFKSSSSMKQNAT